MKLWHGIVVALILLALPVMSGCACGSKISAEEAIAIVKQSGPEYDTPEFGKITIPEMLPHPPFWGEWHASYKGKGHWVVTCVFDYRGEPWNYPEGDKTVVSYDYFEHSGIVRYRSTEHLEQ